MSRTSTKVLEKPEDTLGFATVSMRILLSSGPLCVLALNFGWEGRFAAKSDNAWESLNESWVNFLQSATELTSPHRL